MTSLALSAPNPFAIVTTGSGTRPPWKALLNWPRYGDTHVDFTTGTTQRRNLWAARLDEVVRRASKPVLLIASGESCSAAAWWARLSPADYVAKVAGALLFVPRGAEAELFASPRTPLPFPSAVVERHATRRTLALAESWGSGLLEDGWRTEGDSAWQQAQAAVMRLTARVVEREMRVAPAFDIVV
ncbi:MAG: alpha/beta hydrolase [Sphingomonas sp.]|uniref:alpha/beta hydrolase n=1 Tax=Sphingomonas sp. TaxID=28214 RepID=UPI0025FFED31|nr:alpha/beta hydrolase [Sphingomonas sp.]MBX3565075.1 alpha/beta hydrolase [Sphingomonas sp.]